MDETETPIGELPKTIRGSDEVPAPVIYLPRRNLVWVTSVAGERYGALG